jgi:hypothetical protein
VRVLEDRLAPPFELSVLGGRETADEGAWHKISAQGDNSNNTDVWVAIGLQIFTGGVKAK